MTVNFVNRSTMEELTIEEISGIAFIYNQVRFILLNLSEIILSCSNQSNKCINYYLVSASSLTIFFFLLELFLYILLL